MDARAKDRAHWHGARNSRPEAPNPAFTIALAIGSLAGYFSVARYPYPLPPSFLSSGMRFMGGQGGYLLTGLVAAYINCQATWTRSFRASALSLSLLTGIRYLYLLASRLSGYATAESYAMMYIDCLKWLAISVALGAGAACAAHLAMRSVKPLFRYGALACAYSYFPITCMAKAYRMFGWIDNPGYISWTSTWRGFNFYSDLYELSWTFLLPGLLFLLATLRSVASRRRGSGH